MTAITFAPEQDALATKADLAHIEYRLSLLQWMVGVLMAGVGSLILKAFFHG